MDFFDYKTIEDFFKQYSCIFEKFIHDENYFYIDKVPEDMHWIEYIQTIEPSHNRIVLMLDKNAIPHAFTVSVKKFNKEEYIVSFSDISSTMSRQINLKKKVLYDNLTRAYTKKSGYFGKKSSILVQDSLIRWGGDEFILLILVNSIDNLYTGRKYKKTC